MKLVLALLAVAMVAACSSKQVSQGNHPAPCDPKNPPTCVSGPGGPGSSGDGGQ